MKEARKRLLTTRFKRPSVGILRRASAFMRALQSTRADPDHSKDVDQFTQINYSYKKMTESACFVSLRQSLHRRPLMECASNRQKPLSAVCSHQREIRRLECSHFLFILFSIMKNCSTGEVIRNYCREKDMICLISVWGAQLESQQFHITLRLLLVWCLFRKCIAHLGGEKTTAKHSDFLHIVCRYCTAIHVRGYACT